MSAGQWIELARPTPKRVLLISHWVPRSSRSSFDMEGGRPAQPVVCHRGAPASELPSVLGRPLYREAEGRLCVNYLEQEQWWTGNALVVLAFLLGGGCVGWVMRVIATRSSLATPLPLPAPRACAVGAFYDDEAAKGAGRDRAGDQCRSLSMMRIDPLLRMSTRRRSRSCGPGK